MLRKSRLYLPDIPAHIIQRGDYRQAVFFENDNYAAYLNLLFEGAKKYGCVIHAYVLMNNHVHLLMTSGGPEAISQAMMHKKI